MSSSCSSPKNPKCGGISAADGETQRILKLDEDVVNRIAAGEVGSTSRGDAARVPCLLSIATADVMTYVFRLIYSCHQSCGWHKSDSH